MTRDTLAEYLENVASSILDATKGESAEIRAGALVAWGLLRLGAALARRGLQPVEHITRLVDLAPGMDSAEREADTAADAKFQASPGEFGDAIAPGGHDPEGNPYDP